MLINKFECLKGTNDEILIYSASALDKFQGYIYVEADREVHVKHAIHGLSLLGYNKIQVVPIKEVTHVFIPDGSKNIDIQAGQWVRIKSGIYEGDIGKVYQYDDTRSKIVVQVVPRLDRNEGDGEETKERKGGLERYRQQMKKKMRPPQRFFVPSEYNGVESKREQEMLFNRWKNMDFCNGFLYKKFNIRQLTIKDVIPSLEEIKMFMKNNEEDGNPDMNLEKDLIDIYNARTHVNKFSKDDYVKVIRGDCISLIGIVIDSTDNQVKIVPTQDDLDTMVFPPSDLEKYFVESDHVKVIFGKYEG